VSLPTGPNGASQDWWSVVDEGVVDANGIAHSASPPYPGLTFPGLTERATILVARAAMPTNNIAVNLGYEAALAYITLPLMGIAAIVPGGAVAVATIALGLAVAPIINGVVKLTTWRVTAGLNIKQFDIPVTFDFNNAQQHLTPSLPPLEPDL